MTVRISHRLRNKGPSNDACHNPNHQTGAEPLRMSWNMQKSPEKHVSLKINAFDKERSKSSLIVSVIKGNRSSTRFQCKMHRCSWATLSAQWKESAHPLFNSHTIRCTKTTTFTFTIIIPELFPRVVLRMFAGCLCSRYGAPAVFL